jgi:hypothetical protein
LDSRKFAVEEISRAFNIPANKLNIQGGFTYASVEANAIAFVTDCVRPLAEKIEDALSPLMARTPGGENAFLKFSLDGLLRADVEARNRSYATGLAAGYYTVNDVRRWEDLRPIEDPAADVVRVPLANVNIDASELVGTDKRVSMASKLVLAGYEPEAVLAALGLPAIAHTGVPSVQLQNLAQLDPENPTAAYEVD